MKFEGFDDAGKLLDTYTVFSIGGGTLANEDFNEQRSATIYPDSRIVDIMHRLHEEDTTYWEYVEHYEGPEIWDYLAKIGTSCSSHPFGTKCRRCSSWRLGAPP